MPEHSLTSSAQLKARHGRETRFRWMGRIAILLSLGFLVFMFVAIGMRGSSAFSQTRILLQINFDEQILDPQAKRDPAQLALANYKPLITKALKQLFPEVTKRRDQRRLGRLLSNGAAFELADMAAKDPQLIGTTRDIWLTASADVDMLIKGKVDLGVEENLRRLKDTELSWIRKLQDNGHIKKKFNSAFFTKGDSREPEMSGIFGAMVGSFFSLLVCFVIAFPMGVLTAIYLEEFAKKSFITNIIEVNINNLAAVPSIVFGLLGLSIFLGVMNLPRSTPLVGGLVLALMTLPTIIIASRAALRSVPNTLREAALGLGASKVQTTFHHTVPAAMPGMLTGAVIGMAGALGETAPLLMIGMVAFIVDVPQGITDIATSLPVQIFLWADSPEKGFVERTSAAILVLLAFLIAMNLTAVILRKKFEKKW